MLIHLIKTISLCFLKIIYVSAVHPKNIQPLHVIEPNWEHLEDWVCYSEDTEKPNYYRCDYKLLSRQQKRCFRDLEESRSSSIKHETQTHPLLRSRATEHANSPSAAFLNKTITSRTSERPARLDDAAKTAWKRRFEAETRRSPGITEIDAATRNS